MPSCCSYCYCSTCSNSHTVVLSKPASYSPALISIPVKIHEHAYQSFMVVSWYGESTAVVRLEYVSGCGKSTIKLRQKYAGSKAYVWLKYCKSSVKYDKSTVLYVNFFGAYCTPKNLATFPQCHSFPIYQVYCKDLSTEKINNHISTSL